MFSKCTITVHYNAEGYIIMVKNFTGREVLYSYHIDGSMGGSAGDLESATTPKVTGTPNGNDFPNGKKTVYTYSKGFGMEKLNHNLLTVTDPKGQTWLVNEYSDSPGIECDRLVRQIRGNPDDIIDLACERPYLEGSKSMADPKEVPVVKAIVNDRMGNVREYFFGANNRCAMMRAFTGRADPSMRTTSKANHPKEKLRRVDPDFFETRYAYNADSLCTRAVHPNGNETVKVYEGDLVPGTPARSWGNLREIHRPPGSHMPAGDQPSLHEFFEFDSGKGTPGPRTNFLTRHIDPRGHATEHAYDAQGNTINYSYTITNKVHMEQAEVDPNHHIVTEYEYDRNKNLTLARFGEAVDGNQPVNTVRMLYDERDLHYRLIRAEGDALQSTAQWDYDGNQNVIRVH